MAGAVVATAGAARCGRGGAAAWWVLAGAPHPAARPATAASSVPASSRAAVTDVPICVAPCLRADGPGGQVTGRAAPRRRRRAACQPGGRPARMLASIRREIG